jgi:anti-sigma regulatory factor (Ser/Thr protein kinase)
MGPTTAELQLPTDLGMLPVVRAYTRELAALADLATNDSAGLVWAVEAACTDIIEHAFDPGESSTLRVVGELSPGALTMAIHERGLPFDPSLVANDSAPPAEDAAPAAVRAPLWQHIRQAVDEARWLNHGPQGMELRLTKSGLRATSPAVAPTDERPSAHDVPQAPEQHYTIRRLQPQEAIQVAQLIYRGYGYTYPNPAVYSAERMVHLNETGELISVVAVDESGTLVGHYALERPDLGPVAESGQAVVAPAHRGRKLMEQMRAFLEQEGRRLGLRGIYGQPVTLHTFSQRVQEVFGGRDCGVSLGLIPAVQLKAITDDAAPPRTSVMLYFKYLQPAGTTQVHVPPHHRAMVERIYDQLGAPVELGAASAPHAHGKVSVSYVKTFQLGTIRVRQVGADTIAEVRRAREDLVEAAGVEAVFLELPLAQSATPRVCHAAEADGFFFSGIGPGFAEDGDVLRLQHLASPLDASRLQVLSPFGRELLAYVVAERARVAPAAG